MLSKSILVILTTLLDKFGKLERTISFGGEGGDILTPWERPTFCYLVLCIAGVARVAWAGVGVSYCLCGFCTLIWGS